MPVTRHNEDENSEYTRECWLESAALLLAADFKSIGFPLPAKIKISVGFPSKSALAVRKQRIGECWDGSATTDNIAQVFITPLIDDSIKVLDVLTHELVHAAVGTKCGHKGAFIKAAKAIGLTGKMTETVAGPELLTRLNAIVSCLGPMPHARLIAGGKDKKQSTRLIKAACEKDDYIVRLSRKTLSLGTPICPVCHEHMIADVDTDETESEG